MQLMNDHKAPRPFFRSREPCTSFSQGSLRELCVTSCANRDGMDYRDGD
jgi:hypothetical protein